MAHHRSKLPVFDENAPIIVNNKDADGFAIPSIPNIRTRQVSLTPMNAKKLVIKNRASSVSLSRGTANVENESFGGDMSILSERSFNLGEKEKENGIGNGMKEMKVLEKKMKSLEVSVKEKVKLNDDRYLQAELLILKTGSPSLPSRQDQMGTSAKVSTKLYENPEGLKISEFGSCASPPVPALLSRKRRESMLRMEVIESGSPQKITKMSGEELSREGSLNRSNVPPKEGKRESESSKLCEADDCYIKKRGEENWILLEKRMNQVEEDLMRLEDYNQGETQSIKKEIIDMGIKMKESEVIVGKIKTQIERLQSQLSEFSGQTAKHSLTSLEEPSNSANGLEEKLLEILRLGKMEKEALCSEMMELRLKKQSSIQAERVWRMVSIGLVLGGSMVFSYFYRLNDLSC